jgi:hypothetical protein
MDVRSVWRAMAVAWAIIALPRRGMGSFTRMMNTTQLYARTSALPAIAAALALSSTPVLAQEVPAAPPPAVSEPAPPPAVAPVPDEPTTDTSSATASPADTAVAAKSTTTAVHTVRHTSRVAAARPVAKPVAVRAATTATTAPTAPPATPLAAPAVRTSHVNPVVDLSAKPAPVTAAAKPAKKKDATLPIAGGALAFLAIGGAAVAMTRRRDDDEEVTDGAAPEADAPAPEPEVHDVQPPIIAPAAFAFDRAHSRGPDAGDESWVERAYRGPSADNPSLSLRTRLKRAAFFDKRERDVAAGLAEPVDSDAGLPDAVSDEGDRELA